MMKQVFRETQGELANVDCKSRVWSISFSVMANDAHFSLLSLLRDGLVVLGVIKNSNATLTVNFGLEGRYAVRLSTRLHTGENRFTVSSFGHKYQLVQDGRLVDEDWPITPIELDGCVCRINRVGAVLSDTAQELMPYEVGSVTTIDKMTDDGMDCYFGDCMPMVHDGIFHLFYLYDRRRHGSKNNIGGHQWAHISSTDLVNWTRHPMAIAIENNMEASFRTGSIIFYRGKFYAFNVPVNSDRSPNMVTYSVSEDGIHFQKSGKGFYLDEKYDNVGLRDPHVFLDDDGKLHMMLSTKLRSADGHHRGCVLHFRGEDVDTWVMDEKPFFEIDLNEFPECTDYFKWNGRYYFTYCIHSVCHYMFSDKPFSDFVSHPEQILGANGFVVPKTAEFKGRRIAAAFSWIPYFSYAGEPVFLEVLQGEDGRLDFRIPDEYLPHGEA